MKENLDPEDVVDALQTIVSDVDAFLLTWVQRLDECVTSRNPDSTSDATIQKRWSEFQNEKRLWEAQRKLDQQQIQEKAQQLTEAWLRLEEEQRKFLQLKHPQRQTGSERGVADGGMSRPDDARTIAARDSLPIPRARESAVRQFQQLRREIESSRP